MCRLNLRKGCPLKRGKITQILIAQLKQDYLDTTPSDTQSLSCESRTASDVSVTEKESDSPEPTVEKTAFEFQIG